MKLRSPLVQAMVSVCNKVSGILMFMLPLVQYIVYVCNNASRILKLWITPRTVHIVCMYE